MYGLRAVVGDLIATETKDKRSGAKSKETPEGKEEKGTTEHEVLADEAEGEGNGGAVESVKRIETEEEAAKCCA